MSFRRQLFGQEGLLVALALAVACSSQPSTSVSVTPPTPRAEDSPGPAPRGRSPAAAETLNDTCEGCHVEIAREWRASLHAQAHTDPIYQRAFAMEPLPFCQGCHAPESNPTKPVADSAARIGVACVTCHVVNGSILAAPQAQARSSAPHPITRDQRLAGTAACASCHEFEFPDAGFRREPVLMQSTVSEHAASGHAGTSCATCHMPREQGWRSHRFPGIADPERIRSRVQVAAHWLRPGLLRISVATRDVGHAFPTGDLFRRLEVSAELVGADWQVLASARRYLMRHWRDARSPMGIQLRQIAYDDRPLNGAVNVDLELGLDSGSRAAAWRVSYQRVEHPRSDKPDDSLVSAEIELASGLVSNLPKETAP